MIDEVNATDKIAQTKLNGTAVNDDQMVIA